MVRKKCDAGFVANLERGISVGHEAYALVQVHQRDRVGRERAELVGRRAFDPSHAIDRADAFRYLPVDAIAVAMEAMVAREKLHMIAIGAALKAQLAFVATTPEMLRECAH